MGRPVGEGVAVVRTVVGEPTHVVAVTKRVEVETEVMVDTLVMMLVNLTVEVADADTVRVVVTVDAPVVRVTVTVTVEGPPGLPPPGVVLGLALLLLPPPGPRQTPHCGWHPVPQWSRVLPQ